MDVKIAVTGATGHIGVALLKEIQKQGKGVRVLTLEGEPQSYIEGLYTEKVYGDVRNIESLHKAFEGMEMVFHLAGIITIGRENQDLLTAVNVEGTQNVIDACRKMGVRRLVYTASVHALEPLSNHRVMAEVPQFFPNRVIGGYARSKAEAANRVLSANDSKLQTVVCLPSGVVGPYGYKRSNVDQMVLDFMQKKLTAYFNGAYDYVDVRDVAAGLWAAAVKGQAGESYILSGECLTIKEMLRILAEKTGQKAPKICLPVWFLKSVSALAELYYRLRKVKPLFTAYSIYTLTSNCCFSHDKAKRELGFSPRPLRESLGDQVDFLIKEQGDSVQKKQ